MNQRTLEYRKKIADSFVKCLEEKELHWKKNWQGMNMLPESALSGKPYKGCNRLYLSIICEEKGYTDPRFATFRQIVDEGWKLQKGSKGYQVEYWMPYDLKEKKAISWDDYSKMQGEPEQKVGLISRYYTVFNAADIEGIPERKLPEKRDIAVDELIPKISRNMGVEILNDGGDRAFYRPSEDKIHMPKPEYFQDDYSYNSVALHELSHATGAEKRLNRPVRNYFGTESYAYEELVAEISSAFMSQNLSVAVDDFQMENHKAYVQGWIKGIREKPDSLIMAIREAEKAANYLEYHAELMNETEYRKTLRGTVPAKMTLQEYLDSKGVGSPVGPYQDDKLIGHMKVIRQKSTEKDWERTSEEYWKKREQARQEYKEKVANGELRDKTTIESALDRAQGHEDLASTQAARRLLAKQGIDWKTGKKIVMEKGEMQMEGMEQKITMPTNENEVLKEQQVAKNPVNQSPKSEYKAYGNFVKVDSQIAEEAGTKEPKIAYGNSKEEILAQYQKFNNERMQENDSIRIFDTCSIGRLNPETGKYENYIRYDVATGEEIPNIYLKLPYTKDKELFEQMRSELKRNGARFDPEKKQWYVGADADLSKFEKYLPGEGEETKEEPAKEPADTAAHQEAVRTYLKLPYTKDQEVFAQMRAELKENGARFDPEKKRWYIGADADLSKFEKYLPKEGEEVKENPNQQQAANVAADREAANIYLKLPYTKDQEIFAQMRAELKENGARFDPEKKQWYVSEDADLSKFEKYLPKEGEESKEAPNQQQAANAAANQETANIYLKLPYTKDQEVFAQMRAELKENGARFDPEKKQWYVSEDADLSKFEKYIPKEGEESKEASNQQQAANAAANPEADNVYLKLPYTKDQEVFAQMRAELKENGARFDPEKKQWYVSEDADLSKFEKYLPKEGQEQQSHPEESESSSSMKETMEEIRKDAERIDNTQYWPEDLPSYSVSDLKYELSLDDGTKKIDISVKNIENFGEMNALEQVDVLNEKLREHLAKEKAESDIGSQDMPAEVPEKDYDISVSKDEYDNRCTIWFHDERKEINLIGDQFGVHFPSMEANEVSDLVENYLNNLEKAVLQNQETQIGNYAVGEQVKFYVPEYTKTDGPTNRAGIQEVSGTILDKQPILSENSLTDKVAFTIKREDGKEVHINSDDIYTNSQAEVLKRAMEDKLPPEKFEMVSNMRFSAAQMEELRSGFKDGLDADQVFNYAKPDIEAGDMDLYRYGQIHGLKPEQIERVIQTEQPEKTAWADKRREMDKEIHSHRCQLAKSINQQGFKANPQLVKNIETLNHLTKKENSLKDISEAYKNKTFQDHKECQELVDKIGNELKLQELAKNVPCQ